MLTHRYKQFKKEIKIKSLEFIQVRIQIRIFFFFKKKHLDSTTPQLPKGYYTKKSPQGQLNDYGVDVQT